MVKKMEKILYIVNSDITIEKLSKYDNIITHNPYQGLRMLRENPSFIVLDLGIFFMKGLDVLEYIKKNEKYKDFIIVVCSRHKNMRLISKAIEVGADFYLQFPILKEEVELIKNIVSNFKNIKNTFSLEAKLKEEKITLQTENFDV